MKESAIVDQIKKHLYRRKLVCIKLHGGPMQLAGIPDLQVIYGGHVYFLEVKVPGAAPTPLQNERMRWLYERGQAPCRVVHSLREAIEFLTTEGVPC